MNCLNHQPVAAPEMLQNCCGTCLCRLGFYQPRSGMVKQNCRSKKETLAFLVIVTSVVGVFDVFDFFVP